MEKQEILQGIVQFPVLRAGNEFIIGFQREFELDKEQAIHFRKYASILESIGKDLEESWNFSSLLEVKDAMIRAFTHFFDKGVEIGYEYSLGAVSEINIDFDNIFTGVHGDKIPTDLQIKVNSIIPIVIQIGGETVQFAHEKQKEYALENLYLLQGILISGLMLGLEYSLRNKHSIRT